MIEKLKTALCSSRPILRRTYRIIPLKQQIYELARGCFHLPERVYRHLHFVGIVTIRVHATGSFKIKHFGFKIENDLFWAGYGNGWEGTSLKLWARLVPHVRTIFDIGSNTDVYALAARTINPAAWHIAFEPIRRIARRLQDNVALNNFDIEVVVAGASGTAGGGSDLRGCDRESPFCFFAVTKCQLKYVGFHCKPQTKCLRR